MVREAFSSGLFYQPPTNMLRCKLQAQNPGDSPGKLLFHIGLVIRKLPTKVCADFNDLFRIRNFLHPAEHNHAFNMKRPVIPLSVAFVMDTEGNLIASSEGVDLVSFFCTMEIKLPGLFIISLIDHNPIRIPIIPQYR